jgi:hypothetical protein
MPGVFHTIYLGRKFGVGEKSQVFFKQHTQVVCFGHTWHGNSHVCSCQAKSGKGVNHIMNSTARRKWLMSVIYYYLHTHILSIMNIFCINWCSISLFLALLSVMTCFIYIIWAGFERTISYKAFVYSDTRKYEGFHPPPPGIRSLANILHWNPESG